MSNNFSKQIDDVLDEFNSTTEGLSSNEAQNRLDQYGYNQLSEAKTKGVVQVFLEQFKDLLVIILIAAAFISMLAGNVDSTIVIVAVIIMNSALGTIQHFKAEKSLASLKSLSAPIARVLRNGDKMEIPSNQVVPGDILLLEAGDLIVADGRIIANYSLQVNESSLTGESESINKTADIIYEEEVALGDQINMVFSSSLVTYGRAEVLVTATGMETEIGKIADLMNATQEKKTPLQVSLDEFSKKLSIGILGICVIVFLLSLYRQMPILDSLMFAVALAVAAIPEALGSIVTIVLAIGTQKMAEQNAIIKNLRAVEGLGCVSIICSDKTGTLTQNKMTSQHIYLDGKLIPRAEIDINNPGHMLLLESGVLCSDASIVDGVGIGDPTEIALVELYRSLVGEEERLRKDVSRLSEIPFDSERKLMSTVHESDDGGYYLITKGAIDVMLDSVNNILTADGVREITDDDIEKIKNSNLELSKEGLRVLCFGYKNIDSYQNLSIVDEYDFTFVGLVSMMDPPRVESKDAVADCKKAGIKAIMITGDHKVTATSIARQIGIFEDGDLAVEGIELERMSDEELYEKLASISVYARVSPKHKIRIVEAWQKRGNIVAMTGDGVNDAPALKKADIGIAMGITGTAVSKDAASVILTDDNFATIVKSVANGRNIYSNIKNAIKFLLSGNMSGILSVLYASVAALPMPFSPVHLLFINLLTDSLPAIAIGMEDTDADLLSDKPRPAKESILTKEYLKQIISQGVIIAIFTLTAFYIGLSDSVAVASTMAFATLCLGRLFHGFNCRGRKSILQLGLTTNRFSLFAFGAGFILLNAVLLIPGLQGLFDVASLTIGQLFTIYGLAFMPTLLIQATRIIRERSQCMPYER